MSFEQAAYVFSDIEAISVFDEHHSDFEDRWITIGRIQNTNIIVVVHTDRIRNNQKSIRIISARKANKDEINEYFKQYKGKL